jgi:ankyrin repeat protein
MLLAVNRGSVDLVKMLIDAKANIAVHFDTMLCTAAEGGHEEIVKLLLESGADITKQMKTMALVKARECPHDAIAAVLLAAGADPVEAERIQGERLTRWAAIVN